VENLVKCQQLLFTGTRWHSNFGCNLCKYRGEKHRSDFTKKYSPKCSLQLSYSKLSGVLFKFLEIFTFKQGHCETIRREDATSPACAALALRCTRGPVALASGPLASFRGRVPPKATHLYQVPAPCDALKSSCHAPARPSHHAPSGPPVRPRPPLKGPCDA
jgi:hypothetical protein